MNDLDLALRRPPLFLVGDDVAREVRPVKSPFDDREIGLVPVATSADVERAIEAAHRAFERDRRAPPPRHRAIAVLEKAAALVAARVQPLARLISDEAGKPLDLALVEAARCVDTLTAARDVARTAAGEVLELSAFAAAEDRLAIVRRVAFGPIAAITPFNFPLNLVAHKLAPAIAAGCPVVLKPAPQAPLSALALGSILREAGLAGDQLSIVPASNEVAAPLIDDARLRMLTFTGSDVVGFALRARCPEKRCTLELGGNAAVIVHDDADLERATARIVSGAFGYAGQSCISVQRVFIQRRIYDELRMRLFVAASAVSLGNPSHAGTLVGPVIDDRAVGRLRGVIAEALAGGARASTTASFERRVLAPFFLEEVPAAAAAMRDELFGPIAVLAPYDTFEEALDRADDARFGLQTGIFTGDVGRVLRAFERLEVGAVIHDDVPTFRADAMPYGGVRGSGVGREGPASAFLEMTDPRLLLLRKFSKT